MGGDTCDGCGRPYDELDNLAEAEDGGYYCDECFDRLRSGLDVGDDSGE